MRLLGGRGGYSSWGMVPQPVPSDQVESIRGIVESKRPYDPWDYLQQGRKVRIMEGPLSGAIGIIQRRRKKKRPPGGGRGVVPAVGSGGIGRRSGGALFVSHYLSMLPPKHFPPF